MSERGDREKGRQRGGGKRVAFQAIGSFITNFRESLRQLVENLTIGSTKKRNRLRQESREITTTHPGAALSTCKSAAVFLKGFKEGQ